jgi:DNA-3-methyladenine glycosylase II
MVTLRARPLPYDAGAARRHLMRADPVMREIVRRCGPLELRPRGQPYQSLVRAVLYQQLAGPAATAIERRFLALSGGGLPAPAALAAMSDELLRTAGVSRQKAGYLRSIAEHFADGRLSDAALRRMSDDDVVAAVTQIKGVGRWTADMLLMFCLGRPDVLPVGDLGVQNAVRRAYALDKPPAPADLLRIGEAWRPYRSAASWYLWRSADTLTL